MGFMGPRIQPEIGQTGAHKASNGASSVGRLHEGPQMIIDLERTDDRASWWLLLAGRCWLLAGCQVGRGRPTLESSFFLNRGLLANFEGLSFLSIAASNQGSRGFPQRSLSELRIAQEAIGGPIRGITRPLNQAGPMRFWRVANWAPL